MTPSSRELFPKNFRRFIDRSGKSRTEIASAIGVTPVAINDWLHGKRFPRVDKLEALAQLFGVTKSDLIEIPSEPISLRSPIEIGNIIRDRREKLGLSHEHLAVKANTSVASLRRWEKGKIANPRTDAIENLAKALDLPSAILRGIPLTESQIQKQKLLTAIDQAITGFCLTDEDIAHYVNYLKFLLSQRQQNESK